MGIFIGVLSYNHPEITEKALRSALQFHPSHQVGILHNGSRDVFADRLKNLFPEIHHWQAPINRGFTGGVNALLKEAFHIEPWVLVLTNDCELLTSLPETLSSFSSQKLLSVAIFRNHKRAMAPVLESICGSVNLLTARLRHLRDESELQKEVGSHLRYYVPGAAFLIHRDLYQEVGGFDEELGTYWEDVEYSLRAQQAGFSISHTNEIKVLHRVGKTCHRDPHYTTYLFQRNRRKVCTKYASDHLQAPLQIFMSMDQFRLLLKYLVKRKWKNIRLLIRAIFNG